MSGCFLPRVLTLGPTNGPEDFSKVVDQNFAGGRAQKRRLCSEWLPYIDDFCVRTGRWRGGAPVSDAQHRVQLASASRAPPAARRAAEALEGLGFAVPEVLRQHRGKDDDEAVNSLFELAVPRRRAEEAMMAHAAVFGVLVAAAFKAKQAFDVTGEVLTEVLEQTAAAYHVVLLEASHAAGRVAHEAGSLSVHFLQLGGTLLTVVVAVVLARVVAAWRPRLGVGQRQGEAAHPGPSARSASPPRRQASARTLERQVAPKTSALQDFAAAELHARGTALPQPLEWLTAERVQQLVRSLDRSREVARTQRMSTVREGGVITTTVFGKGVSGTYRVQLAVAGQRVELWCSCADHAKRGAGCKHAGAALLQLLPPAAKAELARDGSPQPWRSRAPRARSRGRAIAGAARSCEPSGHAPLLDAAGGAAPSGSPVVAALSPGPPAQPLEEAASGPEAQDEVDELATQMAGMKVGEESAGCLPWGRLGLSTLYREAREGAKALREKEQQVPRLEKRVLELEAAVQRAQLARPGLGSVERVLDAPAAKGLWLEMLGGASEGQAVELMAYTYDLEEVTLALVEARRRRAAVRVLLDARQALGTSTRAMRGMAQQLEAEGVAVRCRSGVSLSRIYGQGRVPGNGSMHCKALRVGDQWALGSCNFSRSSQANVEVVALIALSAAGSDAVTKRFDEEWGAAESFRTLTEPPAPLGQ